MSPSISLKRAGSTEGGRLYPPVKGFHVSNCDGVVELKTSCRHWQSESQDSALNLEPLDRTRFSRQDIPDLNINTQHMKVWRMDQDHDEWNSEGLNLASCSLSCWIHHCSWAKRSCNRRGETTAKYCREKFAIRDMFTRKRVQTMLGTVGTGCLIKHINKQVEHLREDICEGI